MAGVGGDVSEDGEQANMKILGVMDNQGHCGSWVMNVHVVLY